MTGFVRSDAEIIELWPMLNFGTELNSCQKVHLIVRDVQHALFFSGTRLNYCCTACTASHRHLLWRRLGCLHSPVSIQGGSERIEIVERFKV